MRIDPARRVQAGYVTVSDGIRIAVDVWLPIDRIAGGERVGAVFRGTRYHRATALPEGESNQRLGDLWTGAGFALVLADARGTGASFGSRSMELGPREIADYGEVVDWIAEQPWSNGRVGVFGTSYEGQAAELLAALGRPSVTAVAVLFSPLDPYRELFYPGGCATSGRFAGWMSGSRILDGIGGTQMSTVKPVDGPDGPALLRAAIAEHQANVDVRGPMDRATCSDDSAPGLDWRCTTPAAYQQAIEAAGVPMLVRAGWLDGAFAAGAVRRFATFANDQVVEIAPWGHGGGTFADPLRPDGALDDEFLAPASQDHRLVEFFARHVERGEPATGGERSLTLGAYGVRGSLTIGQWPPSGLAVRRWHLSPAGELASEHRTAPTTTQLVVDPGTSSGATNRWLAVDLGQGASYPDRYEVDVALLTFTSEPLTADLDLVGFPVLTLRLATSGTDGAVYAYLELVSPDGDVAYLTEGCLRLLHRATTGPAEPANLGVPRTFARSDAQPVVPDDEVDVVVELLPLAARLPAGHRVRIAVAGHDASCFARYGPPAETLTVGLGEAATLDLPVLPSGTYA